MPNAGKAMVDPKASRFWQAALQSGLIDDAGLQACLDAIAPEKRGAEHLDRRLARQAVQQSRLSIWQAQQLLAGRSTGFQVNRYTLVDLIGQGGMGRVYLARDTRLNRRVALKILAPDRINNPRAIARFQREARVGAQLQHENLVRIYDEGEAGGKCYLVMEYIEGKNIGAIIAESGPIPAPMAARLAQQVALGLEHAQQKGLIHRDVNPYNILVTRDGVAKLTDLGLAIDQTEQAQVTKEGATVGTFDYVSPEQARHSHSVDTRSDIYSLGCTLYHMVSGQVPFPCPSLPEKLFGHQALEPAALATFVPGLPDGLAAVIEKMMRKAPDERYPTPKDVAQALEPYTDSPAGTLYGGPGAAVRGGGRSAMTETQVVDSQPMVGPAPPPTQVTARPVGEVAAMLTSRAAAPASAPRPALVPAPASVPPPAPARPGAKWDDLGLGIDLGPVPSLTEGLQSGKKRSRPPSSEIGQSPAPGTETAAPAQAATQVPGPGERVQVPANPAAVALPPPAPDVRGDLVLGVDLGPPPALSGRTPAKAPPPGPPTPRTTTHGTARARPFLIGAGVLAAAAAAIGIFVGFGLIGLRLARSNGTAPEPGTSTGSRPPRAGENPKPTGEVPPDQLFAVKLRDGTMQFEPDLRSALQRAIGSRGTVLLNNREPLVLKGAEAVLPLIGGGPLSIRAAEGVRPVLEVEIQGQKPFLATRAETPLSLAGVTIVARYRGSSKAAAPVIQAGANVTLERCAFTAVEPPPGARAIVAEGTSLSVAGCWFEGFATAIDVALFAGSTATVKHSMMVQTRSESQPAGWGLRVRQTPGGSAGGRRRLVMEHCTTWGEGLLELVDFAPRTSLQVTIKECAVRSQALLGWQTPKPGTPLTTDALDWKGEGNQYDIRGKSWVVVSSDGASELPDGPIDLASWRQKADERDPVLPPVKFRTSLESLPESPGPDDFAIVDPAVRPPGADPAQVGPAVPP
jgi:serine/threonine-protein kinase